ncbi:helix-turn-helix transcriptional regulator [Salinarimonas soli]|uniref:Helix-turn-helix domain-containing protein n=1 Tax=Salinarimonas soli TaxID=1638099 RepID=A0A5B2VFT1_9HYPH|nr:hypothetical protein [Salinarimonas soli]KAA2237725.1 hypothetical protein F0L46_08590 [Salinarimonas soli]
MRAERAAAASLAPRGLTREQAAAYCNLSPSGFDLWVSKGRLPKPIAGTRRWDRAALDRAWDKLSGLTPESSEGDDDFARWRRENGYAD